MTPPLLKFFSYYKPYLGLFWADMACALFVSAVTLAITLHSFYHEKFVGRGNPE